MESTKIWLESNGKYTKAELADMSEMDIKLANIGSNVFIAVKAEVTLTKEEVKMLRHVGTGYKVTGYDCKGQLKLHKVSSYMIRKMNDNIKAGRQTVVTIVSVLDDKDAIGSERIVIKDATFDSLILADWEVDKMGEESYSFTFSDWDLLDLA